MEQISWNNKQTSGKRKHCVSLLLVFQSNREAHQSKTEEMGRDNTTTALHYTGTLHHACSPWLSNGRADGGVRLPQEPLLKSVGALRWGHTAGETASWSAGGKSLPRVVQSQRKLHPSGILSLAVLREGWKGHMVPAGCSRDSLTFHFLVKLFLVFSRE